jgi:transcriptional regulator with XRE-family HTH domain
VALTGLEIKQKRKTLDMSQDDFARELGITRGLLNMIENGKREVSKATEVLFNQYVQKQNVNNVSHGTQKNAQTESELLDVTRKYVQLLEERDQLRDEINSLKKDAEDHSAWIYGLRRYVLQLASDLKGTDVDSESVALGKLEGEGYRLGEGIYTLLKQSADIPHKGKKTVKSR